MNKTEEKIYELIKAKATSCDEGGYFCVYPRKQLATDCEINEKTVQRILNKLERNNLISRKRQGNGNAQKIYIENENVLSAERVGNFESKNVLSAERLGNFESKNVLSTERVANFESENCTSTSCDEKIAPSTQSVAENCPVPAVGELTIIQRIKAPESVLYPLWKPTHEIFNNFPIGKTQKINMESEKDRRKGKTANLLMLLNFDELKGVQISRTLTIYDKNVWNACANLVKYGYGTVTSAQIYKFMGHTSEPPTKERRKILESIETLSRARVFISNKEEHTLYEKYDEIVLDTPLLAAEICKAQIGNDIVDEAVRIIEPPKLFAIAEQRGQITTIPFEVLKSPINKNDDVAMLTDYLMTRISRMKNNKHVTRTILLDTLCGKCNITDSRSDRMKKSRLPDRLERILSYYKSIGWITDYKLTDREIEIIILEKK